MKTKIEKTEKIMPRSVMGEHESYKTVYGKLREIAKTIHFKKRDAKRALQSMGQFMKETSMNADDLGEVTFRLIKNNKN